MNKNKKLEKIKLIERMIVLGLIFAAIVGLILILSICLPMLFSALNVGDGQKVINIVIYGILLPLVLVGLIPAIGLPVTFSVVNNKLNSIRR
ncbi:MAG: hypothetical protein MJ223_02815 [Mycoplasmoidaceae bacterium]|nr:hypothetical protein [Mycoplasmoidaceae bacterium]